MTTISVLKITLHGHLVGHLVGEKGAALNMATTKAWAATSLLHFKRWANKVGVPWPAVETQLLSTLQMARDSWPQALAELPMHEAHKTQLRQHWATLPPDFSIAT